MILPFSTILVVAGGPILVSRICRAKKASKGLRCSCMALCTLHSLADVAFLT